MKKEKIVDPKTEEGAREFLGERAVLLLKDIIEGVLTWEQADAILDLMAALHMMSRVTPPLDMESEFTERDEGNTLASLCFRNCGPLEDWHAEGRPIGDREMKILNIKSSERMTAVLLLKERCPSLYWDTLRCYNKWLCHGWER